MKKHKKSIADFVKKWSPTEDNIEFTRDILESMDIGQIWINPSIGIFKKTGEKEITLIELKSIRLAKINKECMKKTVETIGWTFKESDKALKKMSDGKAEETTICDRCNTTLHPSEGYLVYSNANEIFLRDEKISGVGGDMGCFFYCEECAKSIYNEKNFSKEYPTIIDIKEKNPIAIIQARRMAIDASLINIAKKQGLSPQQALNQARHLAQQWWKNKGDAERRAMLLAQGIVKDVNEFEEQDEQ